ncbi:MAG: LPXTG cell wall anchor domain-containing protein, partial [Sciscionella sp.]
MYRVPGAGAGGITGGAAAGLAFTGANVMWWVLFGVLLLVAGGVALLAGRRRRMKIRSTTP